MKERKSFLEVKVLSLMCDKSKTGYLLFEVTPLLQIGQQLERESRASSVDKGLIKLNPN